MSAENKTNAQVKATNTIEPLMEKMGTPTLKALAAVFDLKPVRLYSVAKQPKEGVVYDAKVYNWDAIERFITRRLDAEKGLPDLAAVITKALEIDEELKKTDGRRAPRGEGGAYGRKIEVDGKMIPARRFANHEMSSGMFVALKGDPRVYEIVMQTLSHTVLRPVKSPTKGDYDGNDIKVISNGMLNLKGIGPSGLEDALKERFSGEYAKQLAAEAAKEAAEKATKAKAIADAQKAKA